MTYTAQYQAKSAEASSYCVVERRTIPALLDAIRDQLDFDFGQTPVTSLDIQITKVSPYDES